MPLVSTAPHPADINVILKEDQGPTASIWTQDCASFQINLAWIGMGFCLAALLSPQHCWGPWATSTPLLLPLGSLLSPHPPPQLLPAPGHRQGRWPWAFRSPQTPHPCEAFPTQLGRCGPSLDTGFLVGGW